MDKLKKILKFVGIIGLTSALLGVITYFVMAYMVTIELFEFLFEILS